MKKAKKHSIKSIAEELNISVTTVSFVLNAKGKEKNISDETIARVEAYVNSINYRPNQLAKSLRTGESRIIVFMVEDISNHFFALIARKIEDLAYDEGYKVLFCSNENQDYKSRELISLFKERQIDGYIISPSPGIRNEIKTLVEEGIPVVLFDRYFPDLKTNYVGIDNENDSFKATSHLISNGFKKIAFITLKSEQTQMLGRREGYRRAVNSKNLPEKILEIEYNTGNRKYQKDLIKKYILNEDLDSIYFSTNYLTQSGLEVLQEISADLTNKLGILTFDDHDFFKVHTPSISAISQPCEEMASHLMKLMLELLKKKSFSFEPREIILDSSLEARSSTISKSR